MDYGARMYDPQIGRFNTVDPLADLFNSETPYHYVHNNPLRFTDPTGMMPEESRGLASTFVGPNGKIIEHRDDGDYNIYYVGDVEAWKTGGKSKSGLSRIGMENPGYDYQVGDNYNGLDKKQNVLAPSSGAIEPDYTLESFAIPLFSWLK